MNRRPDASPGAPSTCGVYALGFCCSSQPARLGPPVCGGACLAAAGSDAFGFGSGAAVAFGACACVAGAALVGAAVADGAGGVASVAEGAAVFVRSCAACHGQTGEGGQGAAGGTLVGNEPWTDQPGTTAIGG